MPPSPENDQARLLGVLLERRSAFLAFLERRLGSRVAAEEVLQAAYVKAMEKLATVDDPESVVAWFYRLLRHAVTDRARRADAEARALARHAAEVDAPAQEEPHGGEVCRCVLGLVPTLRPAYAEALQAVELEGKPLAAYADAAGITANNAAVRLHRARKALSERLSATCGACAEHCCVSCDCAHGGERPAGHDSARTV